MDVTFTNVLEGARQYFQGLPAGSSSTVGPPYSTEGHRRNDHEQNQEMPPSSNSYWPPQPTESSRPPTREHTPVQRPSSHSSDSSRPPSHSQYNPNLEQSRIHYPGSYQEQYTTVQQQQQQQHQQQQQQHQQQQQQHQQPQHQQPQHQQQPPHQQQQSPHQQQQQQPQHQQQQSPHQQPQPPHQQQQQQSQHQQQQAFQFSRPQSREAPSNHSQYQSHVPTNSPYYQIPSPYHQTPSPQLPRTPSRDQMAPRVPSRDQSLPRVPSREQIIPRTPSREQINSQMYPQASESYNNYSQSHSYYSVQSQAKPMPNSNTYKTATSSHSYPVVSQQQNAYYKQIYSSQSQMSHQNAYSNTRPTNTQISEMGRQHQHQHQNNQAANEGAEQGGIRTTHNLPPIAALSNYHSSRSTREPSRPVISNSRTRPFSSSSYTANTNQQNSAVTSNSSIIQQTPARSLPNTSLPASISNYHQSYRAYTSQPQQQHSRYQYPVTVTTQNYTHVIMTTSNNNSNYYPVPTQTQSSSQLNYQLTKSSSQSIPRSQSAASSNQQQQQHQNSVDPNLNGKLITKRESPLDLSVKTVRTPADSTLGDTESEARNKYYLSNRTSHSSISTHNYPQLDVNSFRKNLTQQTAQMPSATAPKVEFRPNFNVPSLSQPPKHMKRPTEDHKRSSLPEKAHSSSRAIYNNKNISYPMSNTNRYPTVSIPSAAHVNSYIQAQEVPARNQQSTNVPRIDFPTSNHKTNSVYAVPSHDLQKKRPADVAPLIVPNKVPKLDPWRESIDMQIEERLSSYKQQQQAKLSVPTSKPTMINGSYPSVNQDKSKDIYGMYQKPNYENMSQHASYSQAQSHYHTQSNHSQTYVPSPATHQYPGYPGLTNQQPQAPNATSLNATSRSNSNPSLASVVSNTKNHLGGAVDKRVISLLRNSLEIKGQKKVFEQLKSHENYTQHPRSDVQHPSTDVTAPLQPKPGLIGRNNVSPFTPTNFPDNSNMASIYNKFHIPKAIDSVNFEINKNQNPAIDKQMLDTVITNHTTNSDYDGLAAFLAARIRTKGELKQGGPTNQNISNNNSSITESRLQGIIENQLKSPMKQDTSQSSAYCPSSGTTSSSSPPKLSKERQMAFAPRKRLFSRNEEDPGNNAVPPRDKSGLRSSSETSVFDFPDSDSETDMNGRESLEAMRKGRKSSLKQSTPINSIEFKAESPGPASPGDDIFAKLCDNFVEQLKSGTIKKRVKRKKPLEPEVLAKLEPFTKEKVPENIKPPVPEIKDEIKDCDKILSTPQVSVVSKVKEESSDIPSSTESKIVSTPESEPKQQIESDCKSNTDSTVKKEDPLFVNNKENVRRRLISSSDSSDSETETKKKDTQVNNDVDNRSLDFPKMPEEANDCKEEIKDNESVQKSNEILPIIRPAKKPSFGDGSDFYPGWEEGVYRYKKSLRMPPTLIQVTRPPQFHRLSTSLPDLDPCPQSPTASILADNEKESTGKTKLKKIKSEPLDSDNESNSSLNLFKKTNYDSEGSASVRSLPNTAKEMSILDKLLEKYGGRRKKKIKRKEDHSPKVIPKAENPVELLPTPGLEIKKESGKEVNKLSSSVIKSESALLGFRKTTINNFKDAFRKNANNIVGVNEQFATVVLKSRTRKETRVLKQRATIKEVFGEDRPASAPPVTCVNDIQIKEEITMEENSCLGNLIVKLEKQNDIIEKQNEVENLSRGDKENEVADTKQMLKNKLLNKGKKKEKNNLLKNLADKKMKMEIQDEIEDETRSLDDVIIKRDPDEKSETPSIDGDDGSVSGRRRGKFGKMRRKLSSGFDYIRKKKKVKKELVENDCGEKKKRKNVLSKTLESVDDIQKEIKTWVLNKGIGETHLHRSARLGYTDVTAYCLEKMDCQPSPKDNAGYTPLHEACSRGHLHIAKLLLLYGANASESAQGGIRPLHEAVENGFVEIARLLLSYGADPTLATYSGLTPLALTNDEVTKEFLKNHLNDIEGEPSPPWISYGPASFFDPVDDIGYNILDEIPNADPEVEEEDVEFEISESLLPNLYTLRGESLTDRWILLQDLSNLLKIKSRDALLRQICPPSTSSANVNYKSVLRELKMTDFLEQAHCCQFLNASEKINTRASKIALVKYTDKVRELLNVETVVITTR